MFFLAYNSAKAQNLVPNSSFELYKNCPTDLGQFYFVEYWYSGNSGTPELFNAECFFQKESVHSGKGAAGIIVHGQYADAIEYIGVQLIQPLIADAWYNIGFYVRAKGSAIETSEIGMHLSDNKLQLKTWNRIKRTYSARNKEGFIIHPDTGWVKVFGEYKASGGEQFLLIGNFSELDENSTNFEANTTYLRRDGWFSYFYIDDVFVSLQESRAHENFLEKGISIYFDFDSFSLSEEAAQILQDWHLENKLTSRKIIIEAHTDTLGSFEYNKWLGLKRAESIAAFLKLPESRYSLVSKSFEKPADSNASAFGRSLNRRVEIRFE